MVSFLFNIKSLMRNISHHTSYILTLHLIFHFALVPSKPKGDFATADHGAHAEYAHKRDQPPNGFPHPDEIQQWPVAFAYSPILSSLELSKLFKKRWHRL